MDFFKQKTREIFFWSAIERSSSQGIQLVISILIARVLLPSDYGLIAMLSIFLAVAQTFVESGFGYALIQKKGRTETDFSTVFYFNLAVSITFYVVLFFLAPIIADFYNEPKLVLLTRVAFISLIINSLAIIHGVKLNIEFNFKKITLISTIAVTVSGFLGLWMAHAGYGVWALVFQSLLNYLLILIIQWLITRWHPSWVFSIKSFKELFSFGSRLLFSSLLHTIYNNLYSLVIGKKFSSQELGCFNRASTIAQFPSVNLSSIIIQVIYPMQCNMQDDLKQLTSNFKKYLSLSCYIVFPIMIGLSALAEPLISILLGDKWLPAVPYFQIICIANMFDPIGKINGSIINAKGRSDFFLKAEIIKKISALSILFISIPFGVIGMCYGLILYALTDIAIIALFTNKLININLFSQFKILFPAFLISSIMGFVVYGSTFLVQSSLSKLLLGISLGIIFYLGISRIFRLEEFDLALSLIWKNRASKK
ncbi:MAG: lipopolysaccharide biosynthesis protein [Mariniphaga sp.]